MASVAGSSANAAVAAATLTGPRPFVPPLCTRRRSADLRSCASSFAEARSSAAHGSLADASARITGPRLRRVISTRSERSACRGLCSLDTSTSRLIALASNFWTFSSFSATCSRNLWGTSVLRPLTTMSTQNSDPLC